ncbi:MAG: hypothetical protein AAFZ63_02590 [Bacteroidota bacterium]
MNRNTIVIAAVLFLVQLYACSTPQQANPQPTAPPQPAPETEEVVVEAAPETEEMVIEAAPLEDQIIEDLEYDEMIEDDMEPVVFEEPPAPAPSGRIVLVESDLRKEFPKQAHINIARQMGIEIEDIYYYNNRSIVHAIYVNTPSVEGEEELKAIQAKIHRIFWDFGRSDMTTFFKTEEEIYAVSASREEYGSINTMIYDYAELQQDFAQSINNISQKEDYPFADQEIYGIFAHSSNLNHLEKSDISKMLLYYVVQDEDGVYQKYLAGPRGVYLRDPIPLHLVAQDRFRNNKYGSTVKIDADGNLLSHCDDIDFQSKHCDFLLRIK